MLASNAVQLEAIARLNGYWQGKSGEHYEREMASYRAGEWAAAFITRQGETELLMHLAIALRKDNSPLPWQARFEDDRVHVIPPQPVPIHPVSIGNGGFARFFVYRELNEPDNRGTLELLELLGLHLTGEKAEYKFQDGLEPSLVFLRELLDAVDRYQLYKHSRIKPTGEERQLLKERLSGYPVMPGLVRSLAYSLRTPHRELLADFFEHHLANPDAEPYIINSGYYAQVSDRPKGRHMLSPRARYFSHKLNMPKPMFDFLESPQSGTLGIRTGISASPPGYFEHVVLTSLKDDESLPAASYLPSAEQPCHSYLSHVERSLINFSKTR